MPISKLFKKLTEPGTPSLKKINAFIGAAGDGDLNGVKSFLNKYGNEYVDATYEGIGNTALGVSYSFTEAHTPVMIELIARGAAVKGKPELLFDAIFCGQAPAVEVFLAAGADRHHTDENGATPLSFAKKHFFNDIIKLIDPTIDTNLMPTRAEVRDYVTAAYNGDLAQVTGFINKYGSDYVEAKIPGMFPGILIHPNEKNFHFPNCTALQAAITSGNNDVILALHKAGADINGKNNGYIRDGYQAGDNMLACALGMKHDDTAKLLIKLGAVPTPEQLQRYRTLERTVAIEKAKNDPTATLLTPTHEEIRGLIYSGSRGDFRTQLNDFVESFGKDSLNASDSTNSYTMTALSAAATSGACKKINLLIEYGAEVRYDDLSRFIYSKHEHPKEVSADVLETFKNMLDHYKGDISAQTPRSLLIDCINTNFIQGVQELLDRKIDLTAKDAEGKDPLYLTYAAYNNRPEITALLLPKIPNIHVENENGNTAYEFAMDGGHTEIAKMIEDEHDRREAAAASPKAKKATPPKPK